LHRCRVGDIASDGDLGVELGGRDGKRIAIKVEEPHPVAPLGQQGGKRESDPARRPGDQG